MGVFLGIGSVLVVALVLFFAFAYNGGKNAVLDGYVMHSPKVTHMSSIEELEQIRDVLLSRAVALRVLGQGTQAFTLEGRAIAVLVRRAQVAFGHEDVLSRVEVNRYHRDGIDPGQVQAVQIIQSQGMSRDRLQDIADNGLNPVLVQQLSVLLD